MIIVRADRLDRRGIGVLGAGAGRAGTRPLGDDFVILGTDLNGLLRARAGLTRQLGADPSPACHHPRQRQRHCAGGAYPKKERS